MTLKWIIVAVLFAGEVPVNSKLFALDPDKVKTEAECRKVVEELAEEVKKAEAELWATCVQVKRPVKLKPQFYIEGGNT